MTPPPLNGTKTHPMSKHAWAALRSIADAPAPSQKFNAGVVNRLMRGGYVETIELPSPYCHAQGPEDRAFAHPPPRRHRSTEGRIKNDH